MYRNINDGQTSIYDFILPFGGHLKEDNRWVKLRKMIDWEIVDEEYSRNFRNKVTGQKAYDSTIAFGSLYIQRMLGLTDRDLVEQIAENPYMQYFLGYKEYRCEKPFDPGLLVTFRKRLPEDVMNRISEKSFIDAAGKDNDDRNDKDGGSSSSGSGGDSANDTQEPPNRGTLIIDATCTPADIAFPTDLELCDKPRRWTEVILDRYWKEYESLKGTGEKPRAYREIARRRFLKLIKRRKKSVKKIRKELRYQPGCIRRSLDYIEDYAVEYGFDCLFRVRRERLMTIVMFYEQQKIMPDTRTHHIEDRIVSLSQPWVRPIIRGKSKAPRNLARRFRSVS